MGATNANGGYIQKKSFNPLVVQKEKGEKSVSSLERWRRPCGCQRGGRRRSDYPRVVLAEAEAEDDCAKVVHEYYQLIASVGCGGHRGHFSAGMRRCRPVAGNLACWCRHERRRRRFGCSTFTIQRTHRLLLNRRGFHGRKGGSGVTLVRERGDAIGMNNPNFLRSLDVGEGGKRPCEDCADGVFDGAVGVCAA